MLTSTSIDEQLVGDDAVVEPVVLGEPAADHVEIDGRVLKPVRCERGKRVLARALASGIAARAAAGLGDTVQRQDAGSPCEANHSAA